MAEGGQEQDENNPFSFKKFVTKKDKTKGTDEKSPEIEGVDIFDLPDAGNQRRRDKQRQIVVVDEDETASKPKKKGKTENPFSFKKFLSGPSGKNSSRSATSPIQSSIFQPPSDLRDNDRVPNLHVAGDLPDFVQDHYSENLGSPPRGLELPDFTLRGITENGPDIREQNFSVKDYSIAVESDHIENELSNNHESHLDDSDDHFNEEGAIASQPGGLIHSLPDFLSDAAVSSSKNSDNEPDSVITRDIRFPSNADSNTGLELQRLQEENSSLRQQIEELRTKRLQDAERIAELQRQLVIQKKKEAEETSVMEHAMEQVEQNLSDTTKRAVLAESNVTKLKQEVKKLQTEVKALRGKNGLVSGDKYLCEVRERTTYVAEQLASATQTAETSLRHLLSGVDNLKLLSQVLTSIDKISEDTSPTTEQHPTHDPS